MAKLAAALALAQVALGLLNEARAMPIIAHTKTLNAMMAVRRAAYAARRAAGAMASSTI